VLATRDYADVVLVDIRTRPRAGTDINQMGARWDSNHVVG
jgi:hypothetical protein